MGKAPESHWDRYNKNRESFPPRKLLQEAIGTGGYALDLGAGALTDTRFLLEKGYEVDADDADKVGNKLLSIILNTDERNKAYFRYNDQLGGAMFGSMPYDQRASACDINPSTLPN